MRKIKELHAADLSRQMKEKGGIIMAKIYYDTDIKEYQVRFYLETGKHTTCIPSCTYYTDSLEDAIGTAELELGLR